MSDMKALHFLLLALKHHRKTIANIEQALKHVGTLQARKFYLDEVLRPMKDVEEILVRME